MILGGETLVYGFTRVFFESSDKKDYTGQGALPLFDWIAGIGAGAVTVLTKGPDAETVLDIMLEIAAPIAKVNLPQLKKIAEATAGMLDGTSGQEEYLKAAGMGDKAAADIAHDREMFDF